MTDHQTPTVSRRRAGTTRATLAGGVLLGIGLLTTVVLVTGGGTIPGAAEGPRDDLALQTAGSIDADWTPSWPDTAESRSFTVEFDGDRTMLPGEEVPFQVAVHNASPRHSVNLVMQISDHAATAGTRAEADRRMRLFDELRFTVREGSTVLLDSIPGSDLDALVYTWNSAMPAGAVRSLEITVALPDSVGNDLRGARTGIGIDFTATDAHAAGLADIDATEARP